MNLKTTTFRTFSKFFKDLLTNSGTTSGENDSQKAVDIHDSDNSELENVYKSSLNEKLGEKVDNDDDIGDIKENDNDYSVGDVKQNLKEDPFLKDDGKMFVGGLNWDTTDEGLKNYFSKYGEVLECTIMRDNATGRSRGFAFMTFKDQKSVDDVIKEEHWLDGKIIDPKRAIPREEQTKTAKMFVGGIPGDCSEEEFKEYFNKYGRVLDATLMIDKDTGRPRGFGFVTFENDGAIEAALVREEIVIKGRPVEVRRATPKGSGGRDREVRGNNSGNNIWNPMNFAAMGNNPVMMANYFRQMQQYFQTMQSMGRPVMMNPMMTQMMTQMASGMQQPPASMQTQSEPRNESNNSGFIGFTGDNNSRSRIRGRSDNRTGNHRPARGYHPYQR